MSYNSIHSQPECQEQYQSERVHLCEERNGGCPILFLQQQIGCQFVTPDVDDLGVLAGQHLRQYPKRQTQLQPFHTRELLL
jgi:hypothetical protein